MVWPTVGSRTAKEQNRTSACSLMPDSHCPTRRDKTVLSRRVGRGGVEWALCARRDYRTRPTDVYDVDIAEFRLTGLRLDVCRRSLEPDSSRYLCAAFRRMATTARQRIITSRCPVSTHTGCTPLLHLSRRPLISYLYLLSSS